MKHLYTLFYFFLLFLLPASALHSQSITFSELNYNSDSTLNSGNWVELFNYGSTPLDISGWYLKDENDLDMYTIPSGTILQPGARIVAVSDVPKFTSQYQFVLNYIGPIPFDFGNDGDQVRLFDNGGLLKVFMQYADSTPWPPAADGTGRTLEIFSETQSPDSASNWFVGCMGGSPGSAFVACNDPIVFGEINYNSDTLADAGDWVEIWNHSTGSINLTGWSFKDSNDDNVYYFPINSSLAPDGRLVLVHDTAKFFSRHPNVTNWVGEFDFNISNEGELIRLYDFTGKLKFSVVYNDHGGWPPGADGDGYTLELLDPNGNMNDKSDWFDGCPEGSPGDHFYPNCNVGISNAAVLQDELHLYYNSMNHSIMIEVPQHEFNSREEISIFNLLGEEIFSSRMNANPFQADLYQFTSGLYIVRVSHADYFLTQKFIVH